MSKKIHNSFIVLCITSVLSACAGLPFLHTEDAPESARSADSDPPFIDYWQTRDPAEYRHSSPAADTTQRKPLASSRDVVVLPKKKSTPPPVGHNSETKISLTISIRAGDTGQVPQQPDSRKRSGTGTAVAPAKPLATPKIAQGNSATSNTSKRKGRSKSTGAAAKNLWDRVRERSVLADVEHPRVNEQIEYLKRNPGYLNLLSQRSKPYLHYLVEQIDRRGLPMDLALLPMVESGFEPTAVSPKEAAGLWQIIPTTGQEWGLTITDGYDGRFDIHASTGVALDYLRYLNKLFKGDWLLALAAYNAGPGAVTEALQANAREEARAAEAAKKLVASRPLKQPAPLAAAPASILPTAPPAGVVSTASSANETAKADIAAPPSSTAAQSQAMSSAAAVEQSPPESESAFWRLKLPKETTDYVPRILALSRIIANPAAYGVRLPPLVNQPYLFRVDVASDVKITDAFVLAGIPNQDFFRFNPGFKPGVEPPLRAYNLLLPLEQAQTLTTTIPGVHMVAARKYTVRKGETLATIAKRHGVPSLQLAQWNQLKVDTVLKTGQQLIVYPSS